ncbi:hypothetical protein ACSVC9_05525 [Clostridium sp. LBM24168]
MNNMHFNFLPKWYIENVNKRNIKKIKIVIVIFLIIDLSLLYLIYFNKNRLNILNENINERKYLYEKNNNFYSNGDGGFKSVETYYDFFSYFTGYGQFRNINIDGRNITLEFIGGNALFLNFVKSIEQESKFSIVGISYLKDDYKVNLDKNSVNNVKDNSNEKVWKIELKHI